MQDLIFVLIVLVFFALMLALVRGCDRIIGSDEDALGSTRASDEDVEVAA